MAAIQEQLQPPVVAADRNVIEITVKALILGALLSMILAAANAYIGLLVGLTVSASIPAAAASMGILRLFRRSTILENNMVQTAASAGESLVAGIIFTIPALVMMKAWSGYEYGPMVAIAILGGILGVAFTVPLRRALIVEARLAFPEGQATAEVLKTGGVERDRDTDANPEADTGFRRLLQAAGIGAVFKFVESGAGLLAGNVATTQSWLAGKYLFLAIQVVLDVCGCDHADQVGESGTHAGGPEPIRTGDREGGHVPTVAPAHEKQAVGVGNTHINGEVYTR